MPSSSCLLSARAPQTCTTSTASRGIPHCALGSGLPIPGVCTTAWALRLSSEPQLAATLCTQAVPVSCIVQQAGTSGLPWDLYAWCIPTCIWEWGQGLGALQCAVLEPKWPCKVGLCLEVGCKCRNTGLHAVLPPVAALIWASVIRLSTLILSVQVPSVHCGTRGDHQAQALPFEILNR